MNVSGTEVGQRVKIGEDFVMDGGTKDLGESQA